MPENHLHILRSFVGAHGFCCRSGLPAPPQHDSMTSDFNPSSLPAVFRCDECGFLFEEGIADPTPDGKPRCPQCGLASAREVNALEVEDFVLRHGMKFR